MMKNQIAAMMQKAQKMQDELAAVVIDEMPRMCEHSTNKKRIFLRRIISCHEVERNLTKLK